MQDATFGGAKKIGRSILGPLERRAIRFLLPRVPTFIHSYHLTLASLPISIGIVSFSYLARGNENWLWIVSGLIALQWLTDSLDGAIGRERNEGLVRWGYYMDHFLDYVFLAAVIIGYMLLLPERFQFIHFFVLVIFGGFMVNSYLALAATNEFRISYLGFGPTEARIAFIVVNTLLIFFGKTHLGFALPFILIFSVIGLSVVVYRTQKHIWQIDMRNKNK